MAWSQSSNGSRVALSSETKTLPSSATVGYSSVLPAGIEPNKATATNTITVTAQASAVSGTNLDIALYGSDTKAGTTKFLLKDALVADLTDTTLTVGTVDLNSYPALYYFIGWTADADESANTISVKIYH